MFSRRQQTDQGHQRETETDLTRAGGDERRREESHHVRKRNGGADDEPAGSGGEGTEGGEVEAGVERKGARRSVKAKRRIEGEVRDLFVQHDKAARWRNARIAAGLVISPVTHDMDRTR